MLARRVLRMMAESRKESNKENDPAPLHPDEWDRLHAEHERLSRAHWYNREPTPAEIRDLAEVKATIKRHSVPTDPFAPYGGIPSTWMLGGDIGALYTAYKTFRVSHALRQRWLYFSLVANGTLLCGLGSILHYAFTWGRHLHLAILNAELFGCGVALLLAAWVVLTVERRKRRAELGCVVIRSQATSVSAEETTALAAVENRPVYPAANAAKSETVSLRQTAGR